MHLFQIEQLIIRPLNKEWMTVYIRYLMQMLDRMNKRYKVNTLPQNLEKLLRCRKDVREEINRPKCYTMHDSLNVLPNTKQ